MSLPEPSIAFNPGPPGRWWQRFGVAVLLAALLAAVLIQTAHAPRTAWMLAAAALAVMVPLLGFLARQAMDRRTVLALSGDGVASPHLLRPVGWDEIADVRLEQRHGHAFITLQLHDGLPRAQRAPRWLGQGDASVAIVPLRLLTRADQEAAFSTLGQRLRDLPSRGSLGDVPGVLAHRQHHAFEDRLTLATPVPWGLYLVVLLNVGVWTANVLSGVRPMSPTPASLFAWGANSAWAVQIDGEVWRLITAPFLHGGLTHLAFNMLGLWSAGRLLCRWYGNRQFLLVYLGAALVGSALSLHFASQNNVAVGASGAVFGVLGAVLASALLHRERIPSLTSQNVLTGQGLFAAYALVQGFVGHGIDNAAHVGGLLIGAALGALLRGPLQHDTSARQRVESQLKGLMLVVSVTLALVWSSPEPRVDQRRLFELQATLPRLQAAEAALQRDVEAARQNKMTQPALIQAIRTRHLPAYQKFVAALAPLNMSPDDPAGSQFADLKLRIGLLAEVLQLEVQIHDAAPAERLVLQQRMARRSAALNAVSERVRKQQEQEHRAKEGTSPAASAPAASAVTPLNAVERPASDAPGQRPGASAPSAQIR